MGSLIEVVDFDPDDINESETTSEVLISKFIDLGNKHKQEYS